MNIVNKSTRKNYKEIIDIALNSEKIRNYIKNEIIEKVTIADKIVNIVTKVK